MKQDPLVTCPDCGTANIYSKALAAHRKSRNCASRRPASHSPRPAEGRAPAGSAPGPVSKRGVRTLTLTNLEVMPSKALVDPGAKFALVNEYHELARASMAQSCAYMILAGVELLALKKDAEHGTWEGLFPDGRGGKCQNGLAFGFSRETARSYMRLADAARKKVPELRELCASETPLALMPPQEREKLVAAVKKTGDGKTYSELATTWGLVKKPPGNGGGAQGGSDTPDERTPEQIAQESAQNLFHPLALALFQAASEGEAQKLYHLPITSDAPGDVTGLADLADHTRAFLRCVEAALEDKTKAARGGRK